MAEQIIRQTENERSDLDEHHKSHPNQGTFKASEFQGTNTAVSARLTPKANRAEIPEESERGRSRRSASDVTSRLKSLETQNRRLQFLLLTAYLLFGYLVYLQLAPAQVVVEETRSQSKEVLLVDDSGMARMHLRMYSERPILQLLDGNGTARLSLGMRFDDAPFIEFTDREGRTRASFNLSELDEPAIRLFDEDGKASFILN